MVSVIMTGGASQGLILGHQLFHLYIQHSLWVRSCSLIMFHMIFMQMTLFYVALPPNRATSTADHLDKPCSADKERQWRGKHAVH